MPRIVVAVAAVAAFAAVSAVGGPLIAGALAGTFLAGAAPIITAVIGSVVAAGVSYAGSAVLGLNRQPSRNAPAGSRAAQDRRQMIRSAVEPRAIIYGVARVSGPLVYASSSGDDLRFLHVVVPLAGHRVSDIRAVWVNDTRIDGTQIDEGRGGIVGLGPLAGKVRIKRYLGDQTQADPDLVAESRDGWSADHVGRGVAYVYVRLEYDADVFPSGLQNISAELRGKSDIWDPRSGAIGFSENTALCILDYLRSPQGFGCADDEIDLPSFIAAANICDEAVQVDAAGTFHQRYTMGGAFGRDRARVSIVEDMLAACAGTLTYVGGRYRLHVGAYDAPTDSLTISDLAGPVEFVTKPPARERFNSVRGTYIDPFRNFQASEFAPVTDAAAIAEDGEQIWQDIDLPAVNNGLRAQRLAQLALRRHREGIVVRVPVQYRGIRYSVWQTISVTIADLGWAGKVFRITGWTFDAESGIVNLTLAEEAPFSYAWNWETANAIGPSPDTALVDPFRIPAPAGLTITEELFVAAGGVRATTRAVLTWNAAAHPFVRSYDVQYRAVGAPVWRDAAGTQGELRAVVEDVPEGLYEWRVRARSNVAAGAWAATQARIGALLAVAPAPVTGLTVQAVGGMAYLSWDLHPDLDVRFGGQIEFRHTPQTTTPLWSASTGIGSAAPGNNTFAVLPLKPGTYLAKATDGGGRYSTSAAIATTAQATAVPFVPVTTATEHTAFSGAKTNTVASGSTLRLDSLGLVDAVADWDAVVDLDALGGIAAAGTYAFANAIDLGSVRNCRLTGRIAATVVNTSDLVDARTGDVDDWLAWDGVDGSEADAWIEVRQTDDNPAGSPTWGPWRRLDSGEFRARAFQFRAQLITRDSAFNIEISELSVAADEVA